MCGIVAILNTDGAPIQVPELLTMRDILRHRGPDDCGIFVEGGLGLGHRRLEIIDLASGHQPMASSDGSIHVVFNGEIYNYRELRKLLESHGIPLRTQSDTETILGTYELYGERCVEHLRGMFAFVLWDSRKRLLLAARDRMGIKPLYVLRAGSTYAFASEIKSFLALGKWSPALAEETVAEYLSYRSVAGKRTMFRDVERLEPGEVMVIQGDHARRFHYWELPSPNPERTPRSNFDGWCEELEELLDQVVSQHLMSDVPLGSFLSGGVDSSLVTALANKSATPPFRTFSVGFEEPDLDERPFSRAVADALGTQHESMLINSEQYLDWLCDAIWHHDEPLSHPHSVHMHYLSKFAVESVKVVLTGEGADELFAGYPRYRLARLLDLVPFGRTPILRLFGGLSKVIPLRGGLRIRAMMSHDNLRIEGLSAFADPAEVLDLFPEVGATSLDQPRELSPGKGDSLLCRILRHDQNAYLEPLLTRLDKMSMSVSLEGRVPFLDHKLVEFAARVPQNLKLDRTQPKFILKQIARKVVPPMIIDRPKLGFPIPLSDWLRKGAPLHDNLDLVLESNSRVSSFLDRESVRQAVEAHRADRADHGELLWGLLNLELWYRTVIENGTQRAHGAVHPSD